MTTLTVDADQITITEQAFTFGEPCPDRRHYLMRPCGANPLGLRHNNVHDDVRCRERCSNAPDGARRLITGSTPRSAVIVMDAAGCAHCHETGDTSDGRPCWKCNGRGYHDRPPEQVRRLTEPCGHFDWEPAAGYGRSCAICHDGKPTFTIDVYPSDWTENWRHDLGDGWIITDVLPRADNQYAILCEQETQQ